MAKAECIKGMANIHGQLPGLTKHSRLLCLQATEKARLQAEELLQMPPVVPIRKEIDVVISKDLELIGLSESKFVFTDISFGKSDRVSGSFIDIIN